MGVAVCKPFEVGALAAFVVGCADPRGAEQFAVAAATLAFGSERRLAASDAAELDQFGYAVSLAPGHALVGAYGDSAYRGAAYVFAWNGSDWTEQQKLLANDGAEGEQFGWAVSLAEGRALIGAPGSASSRGAAYAFVWDGNAWNEEQMLVASDGSEGDRFGWSVSLAGDRALLGAPGRDTSRGAAYVFAWDGSAWTEEQKLAVSDGVDDDRLGWSVSLSGERALLGAPGNDNARGAAHTFVRGDDSWAEEQKLIASDAAESDEFGVSVSLGAERALVGAYWDDALRGAAYVFVRGDDSWTEAQKLRANDGADRDRFGVSVALYADRALIGAYANDNGRGAAYLFLRTDASWMQEQKLVAKSPAENDLLGWSVSLAQDCALMGAHYDDNLRGAAYVFSLGLGNGDVCSADADCSSGHCVDDVCCEIDCDGACAACSVAAGAAADGSCTVVPAGSAGSPPCDRLVCNGQSPDCAGCELDMDCPQTRYCAADRTCQSRREQGDSCNDREGADCLREGCRVCQGGNCAFGVCCDRECTAAEACMAALKVTGVDGTCGEAKSALNGSFCATGETCTSGHCVDGVCCDTPCAGPCEACTSALKGEGADGVCGARALPANCDGSESCDCLSGNHTVEPAGCGCGVGNLPKYPNFGLGAVGLVLAYRRRQRRRQ